MKELLIAQIWTENNRVQAITVTDEPALIEGGYERILKLVWDLKQTDHKSTPVNRVWPRLVDIGNYELRKMRSQYQKTRGSKAGLAETTDFFNVHSQLKEKINQTVLLLFDPIPGRGGR